MVFIVGTIHPPPGPELTAAMPEGYGLTQAEISRLTSRIIGIPITIEHSGIFDAVGQMTGEDADFSPSSVAKYLHNLPGAITSPVGVVTDAWQSPSGWLYISAVVPASSAADPLAWMIQAGVLRGLSLTHMGETPLEVSLCLEPARPGCHVKLVSQSPQSVFEYKRLVHLGITEPDSIEREMADAAEKTLIEKAMESMTEENRAVVAARLSEMVKRCDDERARAEDAVTKQAEAEKLAKEAEAKAAAAQEAEMKNTGLLKNQFDIMLSQLPSDVVSNFAIGADRCAPLFESEDPMAIRRVTDRLLCAANHQLMQQKAALSAAPSRKRVRDEDDEEEQIVAASAPVAAAAAAPVAAAAAETPRDALSRAMAATFTL